LVGDQQPVFLVLAGVGEEQAVELGVAAGSVERNRAVPATDLRSAVATGEPPLVSMTDDINRPSLPSEVR
nr:hypothetical protein [Micromonospora sp. DSM 115978]